jgi:hypothetical protein
MVGWPSVSSQDWSRPSGEDGGELPGQVHRVADAGVHPLAAGRAMDVSGIPGDQDLRSAHVICPSVKEMSRSVIVGEAASGLKVTRAGYDHRAD